MGLFIASLLPLVVGPLLVRLLTSAGWAGRMLDAFVVFSIGGLVFVHLLPSAVGNAGVWALAAAAVGLALPAVSAKVLHAEQDLARRATVVVGMVALGVHAVIDGVALGAGGHEHAHGTELALAVVLHRLPVGLGIWWLVRPRLGLRTAIWAVACIMVATTVGFVAAPSAAGLLAGTAGSSFQALVAGSLIHVVLGHRHTPAQAPRHPRWRPASAAGAFLAVAGLWGLSHGDDTLRPHAGTLGATETFTTLALLSAPPLLLAYVVRGTVRGLCPAGSPRWLGSLRTRRGAMGGLIAGIVEGVWSSPCSCGVVGRVRVLWRRGATVPGMLTLLWAGPEVGVASLLLSVRLLGVELTAARAAAAVVVALALGAWLARSVASGRPPAVKVPAATEEPRRNMAGVLGGLRRAFGDAADETLPWFVVGLGVAALAEPLLSPAKLADGLPLVVIVLTVAASVPLHVCAIAVTPLLAVLVHKGLPPGAVVAFALAGAATNVSALRLVAEMGGPRAALRFGIGAVVSAIGVGCAVHWALPVVAVPLHEWASQPWQLGDIACAGIVGLMLVHSLLRQGAEGFVAQILVRHGREPHEHGHSHVHLPGA